MSDDLKSALTPGVRTEVTLRVAGLPDAGPERDAAAPATLRAQGATLSARRGLAVAAVWLCAAAALSFVDAGRAVGQSTASQGFVPGASNEPVDFDEVSRCEGGTEPGSLCTVSGDCAGGGTCVTAWTQTSATLVPSFCATRTEQRAVGTSAVDAFSTATEPACSVRIRNIGQTTLYVGWSGVTTSSGVPLYPGEERAMYPPDRRGTAVRIIGDAVGGTAAVVTP